MSVATRRRPARSPEIIFKSELVELIGTGFPTIWRWMVVGKFPHAVQIGNRTGWYVDEVNQWLLSRPRKEYKKVAGVQS